MCGLTITSSGNPVDGMGDCFHLHYHVVHVGCLVFADGGLCGLVFDKVKEYFKSTYI